MSQVAQVALIWLDGLQNIWMTLQVEIGVATLRLWLTPAGLELITCAQCLMMPVVSCKPGCWGWNRKMCPVCSSAGTVLRWARMLLLYAFALGLNDEYIHVRPVCFSAGTYLNDYLDLLLFTASTSVLAPFGGYIPLNLPKFEPV
ncbi:uncharacterized protein ARMOST_11910 [Armillaria ostoyae]|uniref:Uncharacterized protein n=1 Tax=Armillaria ostoyae TaxID=47428 RepID=A0A284RIG5_ARMOS|nr:uncharacterized protein ARMOST_11910 [Armillaria ostoyae]